MEELEECLAGHSDVEALYIVEELSEHYLKEKEMSLSEDISIQIQLRIFQLGIVCQKIIFE